MKSHETHLSVTFTWFRLSRPHLSQLTNNFLNMLLSPFREQVCEYEQFLLNLSVCLADFLDRNRSLRSEHHLECNGSMAPCQRTYGIRCRLCHSMSAVLLGRNLCQLSRKCDRFFSVMPSDVCTPKVGSLYRPHSQ